MTYRRSPESQRLVLAAAMALPLLVALYAAFIAGLMPPSGEPERPLRWSQMIAGQPIIVGLAMVALAVVAALLIAREASAQVTVTDDAITVRAGLRRQTLAWAEVVWVDIKLAALQYVLTGGRGERLEINLGWLPAGERAELLAELHRRTADVWERQRRDIQSYGIRQGRDALHLMFVRFAGQVLLWAVVVMFFNEYSQERRYLNLLPAVGALALGWLAVAALIGVYASWPLEITAAGLVERRPWAPREFPWASVRQIVIERSWLPKGFFERVYILGEAGRITIPSTFVWYPLVLEHLLRHAGDAEVLVIGDPARSPLEAIVLPALPAAGVVTG